MLTHATLFFHVESGSLVRSLSNCADPRTGTTHGALLDEAGVALQPQRIERMMWELTGTNKVCEYWQKFTVYSLHVLRVGEKKSKLEK